MDEKILAKYLKVKALAEGGSAGEKENAKKICKTMEEKHPGIEIFAREYQNQQEDSSQEGPDIWGHDHNDFGKTSERVWDRTVTTVEQIFSYLHGFASHTQTAVSGYWFGEQVAVKKRKMRNGGRQVTVTLTPEEFDTLINLEEVEYMAFKSALSQRVDSALDSLYEMEF